MENRVRIIFKCDHESGPHRAAFMYAEHFESPMVQLISTIARQVEVLIPGAVLLRITEGHRNPRVPGRRDLHSTLKAIDFTIVKQNEAGEYTRATNAEYVLVVACTRKIVGDADYDFAVHGEGPAEHIHAEFDPK